MKQKALLFKQKHVLMELSYKKEVNSIIILDKTIKERFILDIKNLDVTKIKSSANDDASWVCDINTGICGPVSDNQATTEPIKVNFFNRDKNESEDKE